MKTFLLISGIVFATSAFAARHVITVQDFKFTPDSVGNIAIGDSVIWQWVDGAHTVTSSEIPNGALPFDQELSLLHPIFIYVPTVAGTYRYYCKPHLSMGMMGVFIVKGFAEGINDPSVASPSIQIYPNPFQNSFSFSYQTKGNNLQKIEVYDLTGKKIYERNQVFVPGVEIEINPGKIEPGLYLLKLTDTANNSWARRIDKGR
ncbi:MAG: T9SS type A sorting domain-containing protein [Syntrophothermus sp.]